MKEPVYKLGDCVFYKTEGRVFQIKSINVELNEDQDEVYAYSDGNRWYPEELLILYLDYLRGLKDSGVNLKVNIGLEEDMAPIIKDINSSSVHIECDLPVKKFLELFSENFKDQAVVIDDMKLPRSCTYCPMSGMTDQEKLVCMATGKEESELSVYARVRMESCPLRMVPSARVKIK